MQKASFSPCAFVTLGSRSLGQDTKFISHTIHQGSYQMKITPTSLTVNQLLGSTNEQYVIPTYQRRYSWHERQVVELIEDIALIESGDTHLLGSIVCLAGHHKAGLNQLELVDGQQRLTTVSILLNCIRERLEKDGNPGEASEVARMLTAKPLNGNPVRKIALDLIDADEFAALMNQDDQKEIKNQDLSRAFKIIREKASSVPIADIREFLYKLTNQALVIRLDVGDAKDAFKLFETINNRGLRLSPTDIIKNFLLGNAARLGPEALDTARKSWAELLGHLDGTNADAFFRYYLMAFTRARVLTSEVVAKFKTEFMTHVAEAAIRAARDGEVVFLCGATVRTGKRFTRDRKRSSPISSACNSGPATSCAKSTATKSRSAMTALCAVFIPLATRSRFRGRCAPRKGGGLRNKKRDRRAV